MNDEECKHLTLVRKQWGSLPVYYCDDCSQKFKVQPWDGRIQEIPPGDEEHGQTQA